MAIVKDVNYVALENINILYLNIRSLLNKLDDLNEILRQVPFNETHLVVLTETWLFANEVDFFNLRSFNAIYHCRKSVGGGTSICMREDIDYTINDTSTIKLDDCNYLSVKLTKMNITLWSIYRPPKSNLPIFLEQFDKIIAEEKTAVLY